MHPILFEIGSMKIYSYGLMIALGIVAGVSYLAIQGKRELKMTLDQANTLFLFIFVAALVGGKVFLFFEDPAYYVSSPGKLFTGRGFVFYGSFLFAIPTMLWYFRKNNLPSYQMLDIMAVTTCLVHMFGRSGCFMAGCCYGKPTESFAGIIFTDPACSANPLHTPLHPTQLYEAGYILIVLCMLVYLRSKKGFHGQLFLLYLMLYGAGRFVLEYLRGDAGRGFIVENYISHSQFIALMVILATFFFYRKWSKSNKILMAKSIAPSKQI